MWAGVGWGGGGVGWASAPTTARPGRTDKRSVREWRPGMPHRAAPQSAMKQRSVSIVANRLLVMVCPPPSPPTKQVRTPPSTAPPVFEKSYCLWAISLSYSGPEDVLVVRSQHLREGCHLAERITERRIRLAELNRTPSFQQEIHLSNVSFPFCNFV
jgi:hypothetical protein